MDIMELLNHDDCKTILEIACPGKQFSVLAYRFENLENHVEGFLSSSKKLVIEYSTVEDPGRKSQLLFFAKTLPTSNEFHEEYVLNIGGFDKEVFFFDKVKPNLDLWSQYEVMPKCYLAVPNKIVVLELMMNYRVKDISDYFNQEEIKAAIASLARIHAASMMCESKNSLDLKSVWGDYFFDCLFIRKEGHLGFRHVSNGIKAIRAIIQNNYPEINDEIKNKVYEVYDQIPESVLPSKKFRNVISHADLYTNNIMFSTGTNELIAKIVDFQLFRFNPPSLDLLMLIYSTVDLKNLELLDDLTNFYYEQISENFSKFGFDVASELPRQEFTESLQHQRSLALAITLLYQHYVNLPPNILKIIMDDPDHLKKFILEDRTEVVLSSFEFDASYRNKLSTTISCLFDSV